MKKTIFFFSIIVIIIFGSLYIADNIRMNNNEQIIFSTWGKKYSPPAKIKPYEAVEAILKKLDDKSKETIINLENPEISEVTFDKQPSIYYYDKKVNLMGKSVFRIKFNTTQDGLLGPLVFYVDKYNGKLIGADFRE